MTEQFCRTSARLVGARTSAMAWLVDHISADGRPEGAELGNGWSRLPWALALAGETAAATAVLEWIANEGIDADGNFRAGPAGGSGRLGGYWLGHVATGALLLERYDVARLVLDRLEAMQDANGGLPIDPPGGDLAGMSDIISTAQAGLAALLGGRAAISGRARDWLLQCLEAQPDLPHRLYVARSGDKLVTAVPTGLEFLLAVDFRQPRQAYFYPGIAAAFLGAYAMRNKDHEALAAGHRFLALNINGTEKQFTDADSVQICKFGWGAAVMQVADAAAAYDPYILRMSDWFVERQDGDGSWCPSRFLSPSPTIVERMMKTAEHAVEATALIEALAVMRVRAQMVS